MRVRLFIKTLDNKFYFQFRSDDDTPILNSQGYNDKVARNNGARSVVANAGNVSRYDRQRTKNGKYYFILKANNGEEIARSPFYVSENDMEAVITECILKISALSARKPAPKKAPSPPSELIESNPYRGENGKDNYRPLAFYQDRISGKENGADFFDTEEGSFHFTFNHNGSILLLSESYASVEGRDNGAKSVSKNLNSPERYQRKTHPNGKHYFNLLAANNQKIATSVWFDSEDEMNGAISALLNQNAETGREEKAPTQAPSSHDTPSEKEAAPQASMEQPNMKSKKEKILLKKGEYFFNGIYSQTMKSANGKYYFSFRTAEDKALLISSNIRGYGTEKEVDAAVERVLEFGPNDKNYEEKTTKNNKYYFYLNDNEDKPVAKSFFYNTKAEMQEAMSLLFGPGADESASSQKLSLASKSGQDEYLPCEHYSGEPGFYKFFHEENKNWYFSWNDSQGNTILRSQGYQSEKARDNGMESVQKNSSNEDRWNKAKENGKYYWVLKAGNHQEIGRSCPYDDEGALLDSVRKAFGSLWTPPPAPKTATSPSVKAPQTKTNEVKKTPPLQKFSPQEAKSSTTSQASTSTSKKEGITWWPLALFGILAILFIVLFSRGCFG